MKHWVILAAAVAVLSAPLPAHPQVARPSDGAIEKLIEKAQKSARNFERSLDRDLRRSTIRTTQAEVNVDRYLSDFEDDLERLGDRFQPTYAASAELTQVLRRANDIERFVRAQPAEFKGRSEWDVVAMVLGDLAGAYGTRFPMPDDAAVRRINDAEIERAAQVIRDNARRSRGKLRKVYTRDEKVAMEEARAKLDRLADAAKSVASRVDDGEPASGETAVLRERFAEAQAALAGRERHETIASYWQAAATALTTIESAYSVQAVAPEPAKR